jgi:hypothetical protein
MPYTPIYSHTEKEIIETMLFLLTDDRDMVLMYLDHCAEEDNKAIFQAERADDEYYDGSY